MDPEPSDSFSYAATEALKEAKRRVDLAIRNYDEADSTLGHKFDKFVNFRLNEDEKINIKDMVLSDPLIDQFEVENASTIELLASGQQGQLVVDMEQKAMKDVIENLLSSLREERMQEVEKTHDQIVKMRVDSGVDALMEKMKERQRAVKSLSRQISLKQEFIQLRRSDMSVKPDDLRHQMDEMAQTKVDKLLYIIDRQQREITNMQKKRDLASQQTNRCRERLEILLNEMEEEEKRKAGKIVGNNTHKSSTISSLPKTSHPRRPLATTTNNSVDGDDEDDEDDGEEGRPTSTSEAVTDEVDESFLQVKAQMKANALVLQRVRELESR